MAAASGAPQIGKVRNAYYDADGSIASPTWVAIGKMSGGDHSATRDSVEIAERDIDLKTYMHGHFDIKPQLELTVRPGNSVYDALRVAFETKAKIGLAMMTGLITDSGHYGIQGEFRIEEWSEPQGNTDVSASLTLALAADYTTAPAFVVTT